MTEQSIENNNGKVNRQQHQISTKATTIYIHWSHVPSEDRPRLPVHVMAVPPVVVLSKPVHIVCGEAGADLQELVSDRQSRQTAVKASTPNNNQVRRVNH